LITLTIIKDGYLGPTPILQLNPTHKERAPFDALSLCLT